MDACSTPRNCRLSKSLTERRSVFEARGQLRVSAHASRRFRLIDRPAECPISILHGDLPVEFFFDLTDRRVCQENQIGVNSPAYEPAPYSPIHEDGVSQFVDWYCTHLEEQLTEDAK